MKIQKALLTSALLIYTIESNSQDYNTIIKESFDYCQEKNSNNYKKLIKYGANHIMNPEELLLKCAQSYTEKTIFTKNYAGRSDDYIYQSIKKKYERLSQLLEHEINKKNHPQEEQEELEKQLKCFRFQNFKLAFNRHLITNNQNFFTENNYKSTLIKSYTFLVNGCGKSYF